jgi:hypothetical protein
MPALDTMPSLNSRDLRTSSCHFWCIRIDTAGLVVHGKNPVSKVLPRRKVYWRRRGRGSVEAVVISSSFRTKLSSGQD